MQFETQALLVLLKWLNKAKTKKSQVMLIYIKKRSKNINNLL